MIDQKEVNKIQVSKLKTIFYLVILTALLVVGCKDSHREKINNEMIKDSVETIDLAIKEDSDSIIKMKENIKMIESTFVPDVKINNLELVNEKSIINSIGNLKNSIIEGKDLPYTEFTDKHEKLKLKLVTFPGSGYNDVYQFSVEYISNTDKLKIISYDDFITESKIKLGIAKSELISIKGDNYTIENNIIKYAISQENDKGKKFLEKYNMPYYYAYYTFENDKLIKIDFGFLYP